MSNFSVFEKIEALDSRNEMTAVLVDFFNSLDSIEAQIYTYLLQGRISPLFVDEEFGFSEKSAMKVLGDINNVFGLGYDVKKLRVELGDAGLVAEKLMEEKLVEGGINSIKDVYAKLWDMVLAKGNNSVKYKGDIFSDLILNSSPVDAKFLTRLVSGKLRLGCSDKTILDSFSFVLVGDKSAREVLDSAYGVVSDLGFISKIVCSNVSSKKRLGELSGIKPILGIPIFPRLVERVSTLKAGADRFSEGGIIQPKFDGIRCQIHKGVKPNDIYKDSVWSKYLNNVQDESFCLFGASSVGEVKLFTRNLNDITCMFPDIVEEVLKLECDSCILDGEIIGWDKSKSTFVPFQETMTRKRKYGIGDKAVSVPVKYFAFDLMYLDGKNLMHEDFEARLKHLEAVKFPKGSLFSLSDSIDFVYGVTNLEKIFQKYISNRLEGVILKEKRGGYFPGVRNFGWVKIKKSIEGNVVDTVDTVVLGYYYGSGKKTSFGMGSLLVGIYNPGKDRFESVGKVGTGIKDDEWSIIKEKLVPLRVAKKEENIVSNLTPDVWVRPEIVMSVEADEISKSSVHLACKSVLGFGLSLRFPRLVVFDRDKLPEDATSISELVDMWKMGNS